MPTQFDPVTGLQQIVANNLSILPGVGQWANPPSLSSTSAGTPTFQALDLFPFTTGGGAWTADAFGVNCSTAFTGGTSPSLLIGIYADDGTGYPATNGGPLRTGTLSLASLTTGTKIITFATPLVLNPNSLYWIAILKTGTADTTAGQFLAIAGVAWNIPLISTVAPGTLARTFRQSAQTVLPTASIAPSAFTLNAATVTPAVSLRRSV